MQINLGKGLSAHKELEMHLNKEIIDVAIVSEPHVGVNLKASKILNYTCLQQLNPQKRVKAAVYIKKSRNIAYTQWVEQSNENLLLFELTCNGKTIVIASVYVEPKAEGNNSFEALTQCINALQESNRQYIICGDFNARSQSWGDKETNERGNQMESIIYSQGLILVNTGDEPTFSRVCQSKIHTSIIDLTIVTASLAAKISNWKVVSDACLATDHRPVTFKLNEHEIRRNGQKSTFKYHTETGNWCIFSENLEESLINKGVTSASIQSINNPFELDAAVDAITEAIDSACKSTFKSKKFQKYRPIWWNEKLQMQKEKVRRIAKNIRIKKSKNFPLSHKDVHALAAEKKKYNELIQQAITSSFKETISNKDERDVWDVGRKIAKQQPVELPNVNLKMKDGIRASSEKENAKNILNHFYKDSTEMTSQGECPDSMDDEAFTEEEILNKISLMNPKKAPGLDGFTADIIKAVVVNQTEIIQHLLNKCLSIGYFPKIWKISSVKLIPKPGKPDSSSIEAWRPLGLLPVLGKLLEALFIKRVRYALKEHLSRLQFGFTEQTSTTDALMNLKKNMEQAKKKGHQVYLLSLDIQGAFDYAKWHKILERLRNYKLPRNLYKLVSSYLSDRKVLIATSYGFESKTTSQGCVQGSACGPDLWNILLNDVFELKLPPGVIMQAFADDITLIVHSNEAKKALKAADEALKMVYEWGKNNGLTFNAAKTKCVPITRKIEKMKLKPKMNEEEISLDENVKILGVYFDKNLRFTHHVRETIKKVGTIYLYLNRITRVTWGANPEILRSLYLHAIEPIITYASPVWEPAVRRKYIANALVSFQLKYLLSICKAYRTVSANSASVIANVIPLDLKVIWLNKVYNVKQQGNLKEYPGLKFQAKVDHSELPHPARRITIKFDSIDSQPEIESKLADSKVVYFTDGSKHDELVGAAYGYLESVKTGPLQDVRRIKLGNLCSVFQAELLAIRETVNQVVVKHNSANVDICSDSKAALMALKDRNSTNPLVNQIHNGLTKLAKIPKFYWVKAHCGIIGNELVDEEAKQAAMADEVPLYTDFPLSRVKLHIKKQMMANWNQRYLSLSTGKVTRRYIKTVYDAELIWKTVKPNFFTSQVVTGHGAFKAYLKRFKIMQDDRCMCGDEQTSTHIVEVCPYFEKDRQNYLITLESIKACDAYTPGQEIIMFAKYAEKVAKETIKMNNCSKSIHKLA